MWVLPLADLGLRGWRLDLRRRAGVPRGRGEPGPGRARRAAGTCCPTPSARRCPAAASCSLAASAFLYNLLIAPTTFYENRYLKDVQGYSATLIAVFTLVTATPGAIGILVGGRLADVKGRRLVGTVALIAVAVGNVVVFSSMGAALWGAKLIDVDPGRDGRARARRLRGRAVPDLPPGRRQRRDLGAVDHRLGRRAAAGRAAPRPGRDLRDGRDDPGHRAADLRRAGRVRLPGDRPPRRWTTSTPRTAPAAADWPRLSVASSTSTRPSQAATATATVGVGALQVVAAAARSTRGSRGRGWPRSAAVSSSGEPNGSRVPEMNRQGTARRRQVLGAQLLRAARRVERVGDQDQRRGRQPVGHRHRAHPAAHRPPAEHQPVLGDAGPGHQRCRRVADGWRAAPAAGPAPCGRPSGRGSRSARPAAGPRPARWRPGRAGCGRPRAGRQQQGPPGPSAGDARRSSAISAAGYAGPRRGRRWPCWPRSRRRRGRDGRP